MNRVMSAERLRAAASLLRERGEGAVGGPWILSGNEIYGPQGLISHPLKSANARYIATMSPPVALALADWLDAEAYLIVGTESHPDLHTTLNFGRMAHLEAVADAILGGVS